MDTQEIDISTWAYAQNPNFFNEILREKGNVHYLSKNNTYFVVGYHAIVEVLNNYKVFSSSGEQPFDPILLNCDPPKHTEHRKLLSGEKAPFSSKRIDQLAEEISKTAIRLIKPLEQKSSFELMGEFAMPFSSLVILNMLGLNACYSDKLKNWTLSAVSSDSIHDQKIAEKNWEKLKPQLGEWIEETKHHKSKHGINEFIFSSYAQKNFSNNDILNLTKILLLGGNETTPNLIASAFIRLLSSSELTESIRKNRALIDDLINETLRIDAPTQIIQRVCKEDYELDKVVIPKGSLVSLAIGAANQDPTVFSEADQFKLDRKGKILSFGYGPHYCIGAHLAKQEAKIAINLLLDTFPYLSLDKGSKIATYRHSSHTRSIEKLLLQTQRPQLKRIDSAKNQAIDLIKGNQLKSGEFPTYECYPSNDNLKKLGWHITAQSPFVHANILLTLFQNKKTSALFSTEVKLGIDFILKLKEKGDVWRFWKLNANQNNVPPDLDDTAICSMLLKKSKIELKNQKLLSNLIQDNGELLTWLCPDRQLLFQNPILYFKWMREKKYYRPSIQAKLLHPKDSEISVVANALMYLGENNKYKNTVDFCIKEWANPRTNSHFYNNRMVTAYHLGRAYYSGVNSFKKLSEAIHLFIKNNYSMFSFPELLLAALTLDYFMLNNSLNSEIKSQIREIYSQEGFTFDHFEYFTSKDRNYIAGSKALVAAWFLELTAEWDS